jgi:DNA-binding transcriptional MerR regulator/methylmalonyl-CoA mutase cobalamin-binding subunit
MESSDRTPRHPIRVIAQRTGLNTATIRAWERRYQAVQPSRSEGGQRLYSDHDLKRLNTLRELTEGGRSISMVASLSDDEATGLLLEDRVAATPGPPDGTTVGPPERVGQAYARILAFDAEGLERLLWRAVLTLGGRSFLDDVVGPLLRRIGNGWVEGDVAPAQEHLGSGVIDQVLERLINVSRPKDAPNMVVSTLPGERHALGARLVSTAAVLQGWSVQFLGADLPVSEIAAAARGVGAAAVAISVVRREHLDETQRALSSLRDQLDPSVALLVGGGAAPLLDASGLPDGIWIHDGLGDLPAPPSGGPYSRSATS